MGELDRQDPSQLRISDADRQQVAEVLRAAAGEGRLELDELDDRLEATWAARTYADLVPITVDLPGHTGSPAPRAASAAVPRPGHAPRYTSSVAVMSDQSRKGVWEIGESYSAFALMGGATLDLREVVFTSREVVINASTVMGGIDVVVNARTRVTVDGVGIMGSFEEARSRVVPEPDPGSPHVRVRGLALMGAVTVKRKQMPGEPKPPRRPRLRGGGRPHLPPHLPPHVPPHPPHPPHLPDR